MAALTVLQQQHLASAYYQDSAQRGLDDKARVRELFQLLVGPRDTQLLTLQNLVARVRAAVSSQQAEFEMNKAAELAAMTQVGTTLDDLTTTLATVT